MFCIVWKPVNSGVETSDKLLFQVFTRALWENEDKFYRFWRIFELSSLVLLVYTHSESSNFNTWVMKNPEKTSFIFDFSEICHAMRHSNSYTHLQPRTHTHMHTYKNTHWSKKPRLKFVMTTRCIKIKDMPMLIATQELISMIKFMLVFW